MIPHNWNSLILFSFMGLLNPNYFYSDGGILFALDSSPSYSVTRLTKATVFQVNQIGSIPKVFNGGISYYLGLVASEGDNPESCLLFWEYSLLNDPNPWKDQAYRSGLEFLLKRKKWEKIKYWTELRLKETPGDVHASWHRVLALFELGKYDEAREAIPGEVPERGLNHPLVVFQALSRVLTLDTRQPASLQALNDLIWNTEAHDVHVKIQLYLEYSNQLGALNAVTRALLRARAELASGRNAQAYQAIQPVINQNGLYRIPGVWNDLVRIYSRAGKSTEGNTILTPRASTLNGYLAFVAWSALGRLRSNTGLHAPARDAFLNAIRHGNPENLDNVYQQAASSAFQLGLRQGMNVLLQAPWRRPELYSAMIQRQIAELLKARNFTQIIDLYSDLREKLALVDRLNLEWILVRLHHHGLMRWNTRKLGLSPNQMHNRIARAGGTSYPVLLARYTLDESLFEIPQDSVWPVSQQPTDSFMQGFLDLGLASFAYPLFNTSETNLDWNFAAKLLKALVRENQYLPSIRLVNRLSSRTGFRLGINEYKILYPLAFWEYVKEVAARESLDPLLFLSLVREESLFDPRIHSPVGATGLSQLMPATFREQSQRMKLINPDIYDPFTNLSIGGNYLAMRLRSLRHPSKALMAYNAGAHRVASWNSFLDQLPDELMIEAIPFLETRNYVKKILRSRIIYTVLYDIGTIDEAVRSIYPSFSK